jgi:hypothetical protein
MPEAGVSVAGTVSAAPGTPEPTSQVEVSVVIPARNERATIPSCLRALRDQTIGASRLEVIVVAAGNDGTAEVARAEGEGRFGGFQVVELAAGNKNAALQAGCARAHGATVVLLDADTELAPAAINELLRALAADPGSAVHGAALPRVDTWVSRYWELNRQLVKDLRFDGTLSGEVVALPRALLVPADLPSLFPQATGAKDDLRLGRALTARGYRIRYAPAARGTTLVPSTLRGLLATMLRNRRGAMEVLPLRDAALQAANSALLLAALPAALASRWSGVAALACAPLVVHLGRLTAQVTTLRQRYPGARRASLPVFLAIDLVARALKLWAFVERAGGRRAPTTFRGERPAGGTR